MSTPEAESLIDALYDEISANPYWILDRSASPAYARLCDVDPALTTLVATRLMERAVDLPPSAQQKWASASIAAQMCRMRRPWTEDLIVRMLTVLDQWQIRTWRGPSDTPGMAMLRIVDATYGGDMPPRVRSALELLGAAYATGATRRVNDDRFRAAKTATRRISRMLERQPRWSILGDDPWSAALAKSTGSSAIEEHPLIVVCSTARSNLRPVRFERNLDRAAEGDRRDWKSLAFKMAECVERVDLRDALSPVPQAPADVLRGVVWAIELSSEPHAVEALRRVALYGYTSIPGHDAACLRAANAAVASLSRMPSSETALSEIVASSTSKRGIRTASEVLVNRAKGFCVGPRGYPQRLDELE